MGKKSIGRVIEGAERKAVQKLLPAVLYPEIAPLPVPFAEYQLLRMIKQYPSLSSNTILEMFLMEIREKRETAFEVMDDFVRNRSIPVPPELRLSTEWLTVTLAAYDPERTMPDSTFKNWQKRGLIRMEERGKPLPSNAAAVLMVRMFDSKKESIFPDLLAPEEPDYWCYTVVSPLGTPEVLPVNAIHLLPPSALVWTPWAGASWTHSASADRWHLIGENEANLAAIRFAGTKYVKGKRWWKIGLAELEAWDRHVASLYIHIPGDEEGQVEDLATLALHRIFAEKKPSWEKELKSVSQYAMVGNGTDSLTRKVR